MKLGTLIEKIDQKLSFILSTLVGRHPSEITEEHVAAMKEQADLLKEQLNTESQMLADGTDELIADNDSIILDNAIAILVNQVLFEEEDSFFDKNDNDTLVMVTLDKEDIAVLIEHKKLAEQRIFDAWGDDEEFTVKILEKLEEATDAAA